MAEVARAKFTALRSKEARSLSDDEMHQLLPGVPIHDYRDLANVTSVEDLVTPASASRPGIGILFFPETESGSETSGHWLGLILRPEQGVLETFDPYGGAAADPWVKDHVFSRGQANRVAIGAPLLAHLAHNARLRLVSSHVDLQRPSPDVNTCGRHVVARLSHADWPADVYDAALVKAARGAGVDPDAYVTATVQTHEDA